MSLLHAYPFQLFLTFALALLLALLATPFCRRLALRWGAVDRPSPRRDPVYKPRLGGLALFGAFAVAVLVPSLWVEGRTAEEWGRIVALLLGGALVVGIGALDDRYELGPLTQFLGQALAAVVVIIGGIRITEVPNPFGTAFRESVWVLPPGVAELVTFAWMVAAMNAINFVDGVDGLAAGIGLIAAGVLLVHTLMLGQLTVALLPMALLAAALGFLPFNLPVAKITLGTSGALFLGFTLAALAIIGGTKAATALLVLGIPIIDAILTVVRRVMRGQPPWVGDRTHLHYYLLHAGLSPRAIILIFYGLSLAFGALALFLSVRLYKLYALGGLAVLVLGAIILLTQWQSRVPSSTGPPSSSVERPPTRTRRQ